MIALRKRSTWQSATSRATSTSSRGLMPAELGWREPAVGLVLRHVEAGQRVSRPGARGFGDDRRLRRLQRRRRDREASHAYLYRDANAVADADADSDSDVR